MDIYTYGCKVLREKSVNLTNEDIKDTDLNKLFDDMVYTMREARGCGLAANQVGLAKRLFVIELDDKVKKVINPEILEYGEETYSMEEGCLSIPGIYKHVERPRRIKVRYLDENNNLIEEDLSDMDARVFQHEYDHITGMMFIDRLKPVAKTMIRKKLENLKKYADSPRKF